MSAAAGRPRTTCRSRWMAARRRGSLQRGAWRPQPPPRAPSGAPSVPDRGRSFESGVSASRPPKGDGALTTLSARSEAHDSCPLGRSHEPVLVSGHPARSRRERLLETRTAPAGPAPSARPDQQFDLYANCEFLAKFALVSATEPVRITLVTGLPVSALYACCTPSAPMSAGFWAIRPWTTPLLRSSTCLGPASNPMTLTLPVLPA